MTAIEIIPEDIVEEGLSSNQLEYIQKTLNQLESKLLDKL
jgi:hypothetical protein